MKIPSYRLEGFINMFDIVPDFVFPVFKNGDNYYFMSGKHDVFESFIPIKDDMKEMIKRTEDCFVKILGKKTYTSYEIIEENFSPVYAFQIDKERYIYGNSEEMLEFFDNYDTEDVLLKKEIDDFEKEVHEKDLKSQIRKKYNFQYDLVKLDSSVYDKIKSGWRPGFSNQKKFDTYVINVKEHNKSEALFEIRVSKGMGRVQIDEEEFMISQRRPFPLKCEYDYEIVSSNAGLSRREIIRALYEFTIALNLKGYLSTTSDEVEVSKKWDVNLLSNTIYSKDGVEKDFFDFS